MVKLLKKIHTQNKMAVKVYKFTVTKSVTIDNVII